MAGLDVVSGGTPPGARPVVACGSGRAQVVSLASPEREREVECQDAALSLSLPGERALLIVADGVGGRPRGRRAARAAAEAVATSLLAAAEADGQASLRPILVSAAEAAQAAVKRVGQGAATTLVVALVEGRRVSTLQIGDSLALVTGQRGKLKHVGLAHGPVGHAVRARLIDEEEALVQDLRNVIDNAVGPGQMYLELGPPLTLAARDTVVLASDGLFDLLTPEEVADMARQGSLERAAELLTSVAQATQDVEAGLADDLTFVVYRPQ